ncbi:Putative uncharacterized protein [Taphrina deformans PYCC 5710]|uniref:DUF1275 domain protein n=1 Tax=Taphrina deformans (strain PYCC 5710 / ATCC 11124 / CBS 356.35 / IMI 108563 / JCM 9778 / NBRC 8474) TaxID=1097556 RepID=R4X828_TAPDE|nr:Putative uncharacterized protein [Taphrina deformans PYCC 5710]|eukprot:CCG81407.1 Putative uncharacterized protein [Taphrina deformans PYCC 5710]
MTGRSFWTEDISTKNADLLLLLVSVGVGVIDAFTFPDLQVFAANMTGNTVFLSLAAAQVSDPFLSAPRSIVALASFWAGSFVSGQLGHRVGPRRRGWIAFAFFWQGMLVLVAAILMWTKVVGTDDIDALDRRVLGLVSLLSFCYGAQGTTARGLGVPEIPTVVITSAMVDLFGDRDLFTLHNRPRNRRAAFICAIFLGGFLGGWTYGRVNAALTVAVAASIKLLCVPTVLLFRSAAQEKAETERSRALLAQHKEVP